jgi:hypothetical protein
VERRDSVIRAATKLVAMLLLCVATAAGFDSERVVLIVSADSPVEQLDSLEVRKLFLGMAISDHGTRLRPVLNESDPQIRSVFLQNVVSMTDTVYDRRILRLAMAGETTLPAIYTDERALLAAVAANRNMVSYAWARDVEQDKRFKILRTLWHD